MCKEDKYKKIIITYAADGKKNVWLPTTLDDMKKEEQYLESVMVAKSRRPITCGRMRVDFIFRRNAAQIPTKKINTPAGELKIATPEDTALDLIGYVGHCAGLDNVATVLAELAEKIDAGKLQKLAELSPIAWVQRLGYLLDLVGNKDKAQGIAEYVMEKRPLRTPLAPAISSMGAKMDSRWRVFVNTKVEPDL